jgi:hypothetical protein
MLSVIIDYDRCILTEDLLDVHRNWPLNQIETHRQAVFENLCGAKNSEWPIPLISEKYGKNQ